MPSLDVLSGSGGSATVQIESEPPGAEARTSAGQTCRTPCALAVPPADFTVTFTLNGYQSQTVPVRFAAPDVREVDSGLGTTPPPVIDPNPVYAELTPAAPPPRAKPRAQPRKPRPQAAAKPAAAPASDAPAPIAAPEPAAPAGASPWPPAPR